jgi:hypothetical protein
LGFDKFYELWHPRRVVLTGSFLNPWQTSLLSSPHRSHNHGSARNADRRWNISTPISGFMRRNLRGRSRYPSVQLATLSSTLNPRPLAPTLHSLPYIERLRFLYILALLRFHAAEMHTAG